MSIFRPVSAFPRVFAIAAALYLALALPMAFRLGTHLEEISGVVAVLPSQHFVDPAQDTEAPPASGVALRYSSALPVLGLESADGTYLPLQIDGHIGALPFWPYRALARLGGLALARLLGVLSGLALLACITALAERFFPKPAGAFVALLGATWPLFVFDHYWSRPDESWSLLGPAAALVCFFRRADTRRERWTALGMLCLGLGVSAKNTALWTAAAIALPVLVFRVLRGLRRRELVFGAAAFGLPLLPQLYYVLTAPADNAFRTRLAMVASPWTAFSPARLRFFAGDFALSTGSFGSRFASLIDGAPGARGHFDLAVVIFSALAIVVCVGEAFRRRAPRVRRAFGLGLALLLAQYCGFYYTSGNSFFLLAMPWIVLALGGALALAHRAAHEGEPARRRELVQGAVLATGLVLTAHAAEQWLRLGRAMRAPDTSIFALEQQRALVGDLERDGVVHPWSGTYAFIGVAELLSRGRVRPEHAFPILSASCGAKAGGLTDYVAAWEIVLDRMGPGTHEVVLMPRAERIEISPCRDGEKMAEGFFAAAARRGARVERGRVYRSSRGHPLFERVRVTL
jgi:hypothetical protein